MSEIHQLLALHYVYPLTLNRFQRLLQQFNSLRNFDKQSPVEIAKLLQISTETAANILKNYNHMIKFDLLSSYHSKGIKVVPYNSTFYPPKLLELHDPPTLLYAKGDISLLKHEKKIAVIGSRNATNYSAIALELIVPPLVDNDFIIVSGLAKGADSFAHHATIKYGGKTIAVLGHGLFHVYPKENKKLADKLVGNHLLLTEYPPYVGPKKWHFPMRNRIISGISTAVIVTEAAKKSGTLITTEQALELGKDVFVVPGPIHSEQSKGTNCLLKEGAIPIWNGYQIIEELKMFLR